MKSYQPIDCSLYDHIEVICLYQYEIKILLKDNSILIGKAIDTKTNSEKFEFLHIKTRSDSQLIRLDKIKTIDVITKNSVLDQIKFEPK